MSRSELHDWASSIKQLGGENTKALLDIATDIYDTAYARGKSQNERPQGDLIKAFELLKAHCKNRECNKDCVFYRELRAGNDIEQFCGLCEIVMSDDKEVKKNDTTN